MADRARLIVLEDDEVIAAIEDAEADPRPSRPAEIVFAGLEDFARNLRRRDAREPRSR